MFGTVYEGSYSNNPVAIKTIAISDSMSSKDFVMIITELSILSLSKSVNTVSFYGFYVENDHIDFVIELLDSTLSRVLKNSTLDWKGRIEIALQIVNGLRDLLAQDILYLNLSPENVLLSQDLKCVKLCGFGLSVISPERRTESIGGTLYFMAPEQIIDGIATDKSDIYAFGLLLYYLCTSIIPWKECSMGQLSYKFSKKKTPSIEDGLNFDGFPSIVAETIEKCLIYEYEKRPSLEEVNKILQDTLKTL